MRGIDNQGILVLSIRPSQSGFEFQLIVEVKAVYKSRNSVDNLITKNDGTVDRPLAECKRYILHCRGINCQYALKVPLASSVRSC